MFFVFDGHQYDEVRTLGEAIEGASEAIDCFADQCDPHWPEEVENISFGIVLGSARQVEHPDEHGGTSTFNYVIDDLYTETMKAAAEDSRPEKYDYCELVSAIADQGITMLPGLLATVVDACSRQPVFKDGEAMLRFVRAILERNGLVVSEREAPSTLPTEAVNPNGLHRRYIVRKASGEPVDPNAAYFVLRIDNHGDDHEHVEACRVAARAYADYVQGGTAQHLAMVGDQLRQLCDQYGALDWASDG